MNRSITYREALNEAITQEMRRDPSIFTYGIDVADEDIDPDIFRNVLCIASYVENKRSQKS